MDKNCSYSITSEIIQLQRSNLFCRFERGTRTAAFVPFPLDPVDAEEDDSVDLC
jgi:hypothetical protein